MAIQALLLDVGGVFLIPDGNVVADALTGAGIPIGPADYERAHFTGVVAVDKGVGGEDRPRYLSGYIEALGVRREHRHEALEILLALWEGPSVSLWQQVIADSVLGLRQLADRGVPIGFVSNSDGTVEEQLRQHRICQVGEGEGVAVVVITDSAVVGIAKPDPRAFSPAVAALGLAPGDIAYVGDTVRYDVLGSEDAGMLPIHFDPYRVCTSSHNHRHVEAIIELLDIL